jgi:SAM-dependent methyltransferase
MQVQNTREHVIPFIQRSKLIKGGERVLEIGCGEAGVLKAFIDKGCIGVGVELDEPRLVYAREWMSNEMNAGKVSFISKDIYKVDAKELGGKFDIIVLKDVIEHIHDQQKLIAWMKDFLIPGGVIFFGFPPWQMPFGGHQQVMRNKLLSKMPYTHLLPGFLYKGLLKAFNEDAAAFMEIKETGISIERFEKIVKRTGFRIVNQLHYFLNPIYEYKFGVKAKVQVPFVTHVPYLRNYITTCVYYLITPLMNK